MIKKVKRQSQNGRIFFANSVCKRGLYSEYIKNSYTSITKRDDPIKIWTVISTYPKIYKWPINT